MNEFLGNRFNNEDIHKMLNGNKINYGSEKYAELYKSSKYFFVTYHINKTNEYIPILSEYGGNDENIGIANFKYLRQKSEQDKKFKIDVVYMRYANHSLINYDTENGINSMRNLNTKILEFSKNYFLDLNEYLDNGGQGESWHFLFGDKIEDISYVNNGKIENTYKVNGINYNAEIGNMNEGKDYDGTENNKYHLFVPIQAINKKNTYNGVMLFIPGGSSNKDYMEYLCPRYAKMGYITATMHYNQIQFNLIHTSLYSMLDEIRACLLHIKQKLKNDYGFNENKLELILGGHSLGGHLSLLYGYSQVKNSPIPIKFIISQAGTLDRNPNYHYTLKPGKEPLFDIEPKSLDEAIKNETLMQISVFNDKGVLDWYNMYTGKRYNDSKIKEMLDDNGRTKYDSEEYKKFFEIFKYCMCSYYINKTGDANESILPLLSEWGGMDQNAGVMQYKLIKHLSEKYKNKFPIDLVYMRYGQHALTDYETKNGLNSMRDFNTKILEFAKKYFTNES